MTRAQSKQEKDGEEANEEDPLGRTDAFKDKVSQDQRNPINLIARHLIQDRRYSCLTKLVRVLAWVRRAVVKWKLM